MNGSCPGHLNNLSYPIKSTCILWEEEEEEEKTTQVLKFSKTNLKNSNKKRK